MHWRHERARERLRWHVEHRGVFPDVLYDTPNGLAIWYTHDDDAQTIECMVIDTEEEEG